MHGELVFVEHALQAFRLDGDQLAPSQFGQMVEIEQVILSEQHQHGAEKRVKGQCPLRG